MFFCAIGSLGVRISPLQRLSMLQDHKRSLHRYPGKFQSVFRTESCTSTGGCSNQLSYHRSYLFLQNVSNTRFLRGKYNLCGALYMIPAIFKASLTENVSL